MSGWHSLSGYLQYKSGNNALGRLITRRKVWCVLEESVCQLVYYRSDEDFHKRKSALGHIDLSVAAINLDLEHHNQFVLLSDGKEHIFTAENHESMMIWLLGLQAKRDLHSRKKTKPQDDDKSDIQSLTVPCSDHDVCAGQPSLFMPPDHGLTGGQGSSGKVTSDFHWGKYGLHRYGESVDSGLPIYKRSFQESGELCPASRSRSLPPVFEGLEASKSFPEHSEPLMPDRPQLLRTKGLSYSSALLYQDTSDSDDVFGLELGSMSPRKSGTNHWKKLQAAVMGRVRHDSLPHRESISTESAGERHSVSSRSVSSDSAIERGEGTPQELTARLTELERELISTKCELAKVMNRQTCFQEMLIQKDDTIKLLEEQSGSSSDSSEGRKKKSASKTVKADKEFQEKVRVLQNQNRFLNEEVKKLAKIRVQEHGKFQEQNTQLSTLEGEIEKWKIDYVCLIQSSIRHPGGEGLDDLELCLYGGDKHKRRVQTLLEEARKINPRLPTYESLANSEVHVDVYGFKHVYTNTGLLLHYLCTELTHHYLVQAGVYEEHQKRWTMFMRQHGKDLLKNVGELKCLCRGGVPDRFRRQVWRQLVHHKVKEIMKIKGDYYYRNLCNMLPESPLAACYRKQISLDLMRTMPNNIKFSSPGSKGIMDLQDVLLAFCVHNPAVGYCQGMNFIVGMSLIFMEAEDAFWTLVAIAERYFSPHYFDHSLIGAQADQQILKDMVKEKLPALYEHLETIDIELSTITLNWFLAVFFDAVPFQTLLRVWDCFLLEGPKVLFRFSLAILKLHEKDILQKTDTMGIMKHLKACAKLSYDVEGIVQLAFNGLKPFTKRREILNKESTYLNVLKEKHKKKELQRLAFAEREQLYMNMEAEAGTFMGIECAVAVSEGDAWFCYGDQHAGRLCHVSCQHSCMSSSDYQLDSRLMCMCTMAPDRLVLGTISWRLVAMDTVKQEQVWQIQLHDAILSVCCYDDEETMATRIFAGLADGTVAVTEKQSDQTEPSMDVIYIPIGQAPVTCLMLLGEQVWSASGNTVAVIHAKTLDTMDTFSVSVNPYDHILSLVPSEFGIWISLRGSSILELWDPKTLNCRMLYDTRTDRYPQLRKEDDTYFNRARITSTLVNGNRVWVGTGEGNLIIYEIVESAQLKTPTENSPSVETNSTLSFIARPERKKGVYGSEMTLALQALCDMKRDSGNISGDSLEVHHDDDDDKLSDYSVDGRHWARRKANVPAKTETIDDGSIRRLTRRTSSENDVGALGALRYPDSNSESQDIDGFLAVKRPIPKICSENDLKKLREERFSLESEICADDEDVLEKELEAEARRQSLSLMAEVNGPELEMGSRSGRQSQTGSVSGIEHAPSRKTSLDHSQRRKTSLAGAQNTSGEHYKSDDSGCETQPAPRKRKTSGTASRKTSQTLQTMEMLPGSDSMQSMIVPGNDVLLTTSEAEEDVLEARMEQRARKMSLVMLDDNDLGAGPRRGSDPSGAGRVPQNKRVQHLLALHQESSAYSDSSISLDLDDTGYQCGRPVAAPGGTGMQLLPVYLDDSYLSSSPGMSITPSPTPYLEPGPKTSPLGMSFDSLEEETVRRSKSHNFLFGNTSFQQEAAPARMRRQSVIEDMSVMCSDCRLLKRKCSDCKLLLTGQELLKLNERRMSLIEPPRDLETRKEELKQELSKLNGTTLLQRVQDETLVDKVGTDSIVNKCCEKSSTVTVAGNWQKSAEISVPATVTVAGTDVSANFCALKYAEDNSVGLESERQRKSEMFHRHTRSVESDTSNKALDNLSTESCSKRWRERNSSSQDKLGKMFPMDKDRKHLSRKEKVGYWLSSIASTQDFSIEKDDIITEGKKSMYKANSEPRQRRSDSEEDVFYETVEADKIASRPKSLSLDHGKRSDLNTMKTLRSESVGSEGSSGIMRQSMSTMPDVTVNKHDPGTQYRLDFTNVQVTEADCETSPTTPTGKPRTMDDRGRQPLAKQERTDKEEEIRITERQRIFEFLKTPSLATRHSSLGLKIIDDDMEWTELYGGANPATPSPTSSVDQRLADFLRTPSMSSKQSSLWSSYENISTPANNEPIESKLILPTLSSRGNLSHSASSASIGSDNDLIYNVDLSLEAKVKISDKPVKCLLATSCNNEPIILSFSGSHGDDEAVLKWRKHQNEDLWTNEPVMEICPKTKQTILPTYMRRRNLSNSSYSSADSARSFNLHKH